MASSIAARFLRTVESTWSAGMPLGATLAGAVRRPGTDSRPVLHHTPTRCIKGETVAARGWARDAMPVGLESTPTTEFPGKDGKAGVWRGTFGSGSRQGMKPFVWSGINAEDAPTPGINPGSEDSFSASNTSTRPFDFN